MTREKNDVCKEEEEEERDQRKSETIRRKKPAKKWIGVNREDEKEENIDKRKLMTR